MALDGTYAGLKASVADWVNRADLTSQVPDFIALAEAQISRRLLKDGPVREMMGKNDAYTVAAEYVAVPSDFMGVRALYLSGNYLPLEVVDPEEIVLRKTLYPSQSGDPQIYAIVGTNIRFWPWNAGTFTASLIYWQRIPALTAINTSNWLLTSDPDIYLFGALTASAPFLKDDDRVAVWGGLFTAGIADKVGADKVSRSAPHLGVSIVPGGTP